MHAGAVGPPLLGPPGPTRYNAPEGDPMAEPYLALQVLMMPKDANAAAVGQPELARS